MKIVLSPIASAIADQLPVVAGDTVTYRSETYDLAPLPDGATVEADSPFIGNISRVNSELQFTLEYQYNAKLAEDNQPTDWASYTFVVTEGECPDPIIYKPVQQDPEPVSEVLND
ncbi:hypothetical protein [Arsukibacterium sp.]|uniref:hypothetical protein n=1 Tax=Arsukibacterium sp. TaxID=1977258 RepID=UPI00299DEE8F|nr:hypothetical protein [Arsukibacterium sp.]MDX1538817.1 hypothetical protein [Arsukibacterium sp.]